MVFTKRGEPWFCIAGIWRADKAVGEAFTMLKMPAQRAFNHPGQRSSGAAPAFMKCHIVAPPGALSDPYIQKQAARSRLSTPSSAIGNRSLESERCGPIAERRGLFNGLGRCVLSRGRTLALGGRQLVVLAWLDASQRGGWFFRGRRLEQGAQDSKQATPGLPIDERRSVGSCPLFGVVLQEMRKHRRVAFAPLIERHFQGAFQRSGDPSVSCGLTISAWSSSFAAPANCESISTPGSAGSCAARNSLATRFMPSRNGVVIATSAAR